MIDTTDYDLALTTREWYSDQGVLCHVVFNLKGFSGNVNKTKYRVVNSRTQEPLALLEG